MNSTMREAQEHPITYKGRRAITLNMVDLIHERPQGTAKRTFRKHKKRFVKGRHFWELTGDAMRPLKDSGFVQAKAKSTILLSEFGYLMLVKPMQDDLSWERQEQLIEGYFRVIREPSIQDQIKEAIEAQMKSQEAQNNYNNKMFKLLLSFGASAMATARHHRPKNPNQNKLPFPKEGGLEIGVGHDKG